MFSYLFLYFSVNTLVFLFYSQSVSTQDGNMQELFWPPIPKTGWIMQGLFWPPIPKTDWIMQNLALLLLF